ncbi:MAG: hypothetical protein MZV64_42955 [Ignavibacteriales bacterium]|nr:hypothetical protein [Ignavibacteriales bacterium]
MRGRLACARVVAPRMIEVKNDSMAIRGSNAAHRSRRCGRLPALPAHSPVDSLPAVATICSPVVRVLVLRAEARHPCISGASTSSTSRSSPSTSRRSCGLA